MPNAASTDKEVSTAEVEFVCETCGKVFKSSSGRKYHTDSNPEHKFPNYTPVVSGRRIAPDLSANIQKLHREGYSNKEIADKLGVKNHVVYYQLTKEKTNGRAIIKLRANGSGKSIPQGSENGRNEDALIAYIYGYTKAQIEQYAKGLSLSETFVARRVGDMLRRS